MTRRCAVSRSERGDATVVVLAVAVLVAAAIAAAGFVLAGRGETDAASQDIHAIDRADAAEGQQTLASAVQAAQLYFSESQSYAGFTPQAATNVEPGIRWTSGPAAQGVVSIRSATATGIVFVTQTAPGAFACAAANGATITYGSQDAASPAACTG
jgi:hypothetical protein